MSEKENPPQEQPMANDSSVSVEKLQEDLNKIKNDYLYLQAEFDNYRKNAIKERSQYLKYAAERVVVEILSVLDNFERALNSFKGEADDPFKKGMELIKIQLRSVLEQSGVTEIASEGKPFDPLVHEALSSEETEEHEPGIVTRVFRKAFKLHDKLIRPAQVVVAKKKQAPPPEQQ